MSIFENPFRRNPKETPPKPDLADEKEPTPEDLKNAERDEQTLEKSIERAETIDDLIETFRNTDGIMTSNGFCGSEKMIEILELARDGNPDFAISYITRNLGLRDKVREILARKEEKPRAERNEQVLEKSIEKAETIDDLIEIFENADGIKGSNKFYRSKEVIESLELAKEFPGAIKEFPNNFFTGNLGLRDKVLEILARKEEKPKAEKNEQALEKSIESARTIDDLIEIFKNTDGIMTSRGFCNSEKMIKILEFAKDDPDSAITYVTTNLGLRNKVREISAREKREKVEREKGDKAMETKKQSEAIELDLKNSRGALERIGDNADKKDKIKALEERIAYLEGKKLELKDNLDILEGEEIDSIDSIKNKEITISKIKMKAGRSSEVQRGQEFSGFSSKENITKNGRIFLEKNGRPLIDTSRIKSIKKCEDGSYIIETNTSFYRLDIAA